MNLNNLLNEINNDPSINFIATAITPLHMVGIQAVIEKLNNQGIYLNGFILTRAHGKTGRLNLYNRYISDKNNIRCEPFDMGFANGKIPFIKSHINALYAMATNKKQNTIYIVWTKVEYDWVYLLEKYTVGYKIVFIIIDDGAGCYNSRFFNELSLEKDRLSRKREKGILMCAKSYMKVLCMVLYERALNVLVKYKGCLRDYRIFITNSQNMILGCNKEIVGNYVNSFRLSVDEKEGHKGGKILNGCILYNTQCLVESGLTNGIVDYELYKETIEIAKSMCKNVVIKPHPREVDIHKYESLNANILSTNCAQESLLAFFENKPLCIVSIFSSTLLNAKGLFDIPAISLAKIMLKYDLNNDLRAILKKYIKQYSNIIQFPSTFEEYYNIIKNEMEKRNEQ